MKTILFNDSDAFIYISDISPSVNLDAISGLTHSAIYEDRRFVGNVLISALCFWFIR